MAKNMDRLGDIAGGSGPVCGNDPVFSSEEAFG
jgi:hypothetical protein